MEAIVLAGGFGTRLREVVQNLPKPMAPVAGRPFLEILLHSLAIKGFSRVILSLGYMSEKIIEHFGNEFEGMLLVYEIEKHPLGTGGAVKQALTQCKEDHVFVFNGDTYLNLEVNEVESQWQKQHFPIIVARGVPDTARYGRLNFSEKRVIGFLEKGMAGAGLINAGCYVLPINILNEFTLGVNFSLETDFLAKYVEKQRVDLFVTKGQFIDIGVPDDYERSQTELAGISI